MANPEDVASAGHSTPRLMRLRLWCSPVAVVLVLMALLGTLYLAYVLNPEKNLHNFPVALVNQDVGDVLNGKVTNAGQQLADGLAAGIPKQQVDLRVVGIGSAEYQLQTGQVYGAIIIPGDFTKRLFILAAGSVVPGSIDQPIITVRTNPRVGAYAAQIVQRIADQALDQANQTVGQQLTEQVKTQLKSTPISAASQLILAAPFREVIAPYHPLPDGAGQGLSAFFYALLLLLAGFTGAMIINTMTDSALGFIPMEYGPWYRNSATPTVSRFRTLLLKWAIMTVTALLVAGVFLIAGRAEGMPVDFPLALYLYSVFAIIAVGYTALAILAAIGNAGLLVNLILFVVLGLPSCGGTVPIEAVPRYIAWLARFEPMHQVFLGVRAILYFEARLDAGLSRAGWMTLLGLVIGLVLGVAVTQFYDRRGLHRAPRDS